MLTYCLLQQWLAALSCRCSRLSVAIAGFMIRLYLGKALSTVKNQKPSQKTARRAYSTLQLVEQQLRDEIAGFASALRCSHDLTAANAKVRLIVSRTSDVINRAESALQPF